MIYYKSEEEIERLRQSNILIGRTLAEIAKVIEPGVTTLQLDELSETYIRDNGGVPAFKGYSGFPSSLCISINEEVVHGIPSKDRVIQDGDVVSVDCGVLLDGYIGDSAYTFPVGNVKKEVLKLLDITKEALYLGIENAVEGNRLGDIGAAIQNHVQSFGYSVVREMVGHGVGRDLHEDPQVPNYGKAGKGLLLKSGLVIAIEPMVNLGARNIIQAEDGWTIIARDRKPSAHFEHSIAVRKNQADILSTFSYIEEVLKNKNN
ncbi:MAG: type I methionyl aminopeptidase [Paludibacteraceae bacterium]|nr:type I methionyl aminopeptidase [Paludibacteraceae bacterium]